MKWRKLGSLRQWTHVFRRLPRLFISSHVSLGDKLLFFVPALLYWVLPDIIIPIPFMPLDDIGVTMLLMNWFVTRMERKYPQLSEPSRNHGE
ncbi:hypothetical protein OIN60_13400 [Paenibacillus sp. P96]|uniref:DUF1232 domain-containing protein n=1 Tax=Paenibacillus zeirhizosphaerae TaxID=2987519 RepID=A0ABT9FTE2_9BACL|nr:hypothetical protein [Paenibacillus sp. P96]MDP4097766.1 hypothetical protein [Paenibacillus sp. P96]